jgi:hypothetical protein
LNADSNREIGTGWLWTLKMCYMKRRRLAAGIGGADGNNEKLIATLERPAGYIDVYCPGPSRDRDTWGSDLPAQLPDDSNIDCRAVDRCARYVDRGERQLSDWPHSYRSGSCYLANQF